MNSEGHFSLNKPNILYIHNIIQGRNDRLSEFVGRHNILYESPEINKEYKITVFEPNMKFT